jgi:hypothetical protein
MPNRASSETEQIRPSLVVVNHLNGACTLIVTLEGRKSGTSSNKNSWCLFFSTNLKIQKRAAMILMTA